MTRTQRRIAQAVWIFTIGSAIASAFLIGWFVTKAIANLAFAQVNGAAPW